MKTNTKITFAALCSAGLAVSTTSAGFINMQYVLVENAGNPNDTVTASDDSGLYFGGVDHVYQIGKDEVTLTQYAAFLNAVAKSDPNDLYHIGMAGDLNTRGIARSGVSGSYSYTVIGDGDRPVTHVSILDAMRFANWLHHEQPTGEQAADMTEDGAYTLSLGVLAPRNAGAIVFLPSESEWYKAAYYDPTKGGGNYWLYPTRSDNPPGNVVGPLPNQCNYFTNLGSNVYSVTQSPSYNPSLNYLTPVGAFTSSASHYGTFDQGGNVWEWNEAVIGAIRGIRGNSWSIWPEAKNLQSSTRGYSDPTSETNYIGFRVARLPDTDGDGFPDSFETGTGIYVSPTDTGTNPTNPDTDNDGLRDGEEFTTYNTNPLVADTDLDGFKDGYEVLTGKSPTDINDKPALVAEARTAIEFTFPAALGKTYRIEDSLDLQTWGTVESGIAGNGTVIQRFYTTRNMPKRYFRVEEDAP